MILFWLHDVEEKRQDQDQVSLNVLEGLDCRANQGDLEGKDLNSERQSMNLLLIVNRIATSI